jgi:hypothetical protein
VPTGLFVNVLIEERAFNKANLMYLFKYLSNYFPDPLDLGITVHTSLMTLQTPEEGAAASSRDGFRHLYKTASYFRSNNKYGGCNAGFLYDTGKSGSFIVKRVKLPCTHKEK